MLKVGNKKIESIFIGEQRGVSRIYKGIILVWEAIKSCFGFGVWNGDKIWNSDETWINE